MIPVSVFSNEDKLRHVEWPDELCCKPEIGEYIASKDHQHSRRIVRIEYRTGKKRTCVAGEYYDREYSYLGIELQTKLALE